MKKLNKILIALSTATLVSCIWSGRTQAEVTYDSSNGGNIPSGLKYCTDVPPKEDLFNDLQSIYNIVREHVENFDDCVKRTLCWMMEFFCITAGQTSEDANKISTSRPFKDFSIAASMFCKLKIKNKAIFDFYYSKSLKTGEFGVCQQQAGYFNYILETAKIPHCAIEMHLEINKSLDHAFIAYRHPEDECWYVLPCLTTVVPLRDLTMENYLCNVMKDEIEKGNHTFNIISEDYNGNIKWYRLPKFGTKDFEKVKPLLNKMFVPHLLGLASQIQQ